jgi:ABC-type lipoprotein release transport system permease subunit
MNAFSKLYLRSLFRNKGRTLLLALLTGFAAFVMAYFAQFLRGVTVNFTDNLIELASGDAYIASKVEAKADETIFDRKYEFFRLPETFYTEAATIANFESVHERLDFEATLDTGEDSAYLPVGSFKPSNEPALVRNFTFAEGRMFSDAEYGIILPVDTARRYNLKVGDTVSLITRSVDKRINLLTYTVTGTFTTGNLSAWFNNSAYISLASARMLVNDPRALTRLNVHFDAEAKHDEYMPQLESLLQKFALPANPALGVTYWKDGSKFFTDLAFTIEAGFFIVVGIICTILGASIVFTSMMNIMERRKEIATYGALGASPKMVRKILLYESIFLSDISSIIGIVIAAICYVLTKDIGIPIHNAELSGFLGSSHFYPALDWAGFWVPFVITKVVAGQAVYFIGTYAARQPLSEAMA